MKNVILKLPYLLLDLVLLLFLSLVVLAAWIVIGVATLALPYLRSTRI